MSEIDHFIHTAEPLQNQPFHYKQCGLDNIYLMNGYCIEQTAYGEAVSIRDADELHKAIGVYLVQHRKVLSAKEVRFLRKQLELTQAELGSLMGQSSQQVARWEKGQSGIQGPADRLLRFIFLFSIMSEQERKEFMGLLEALDEMDAPAVEKPIVFQSTEDGWLEAA
ncbi:MAG TPA: helix-turn-helix domain-containing protein [Methyloceanibacter sp.]|nr:helix-turn-helix domain-containing protein [Methyloceanibacter sp.]